MTGSPKPPPERISLTFAALNRAESVWFLVSGEAKAPAVARALAGGTDPHDCPAAGVSGAEETIWFLDRPAASAPLTAAPAPQSHRLTGDFCASTAKYRWRSDRGRWRRAGPRTAVRSVHDRRRRKRLRTELRSAPAGRGRPTRRGGSASR